MIVRFDASNQNKPIAVSGSFQGWVVAWGFAPFWLGTDVNALSVQGSAPGGFNLEVRDGVYINNQGVGGANPSPSPAPVYLPWNGPLYVLNGTGPADQTNNAVMIQLMPSC